MGNGPKCDRSCTGGWYILVWPLQRELLTDFVVVAVGAEGNDNASFACGKLARSNVCLWRLLGIASHLLPFLRTLLANLDQLAQQVRRLCRCHIPPSQIVRHNEIAGAAWTD